MLLAFTGVQQLQAVFRYDIQQQELYLYQVKLRSIHQLLPFECPGFTETKSDVSDGVSAKYQLEVARKSYETLLKNLLDCLNVESQKTSNRSSLTSSSKNLTSFMAKPMPNPTTVAPTATSTNRPSTKTTTVAPQPAECLTATNLTQSWRLDHNGSHVKPNGSHSSNGYACDFHIDLQWFRFSGDGGKRSAQFACECHLFHCYF